jgi:hypothetical protein
VLKVIGVVVALQLRVPLVHGPLLAVLLLVIVFVSLAGVDPLALAHVNDILRICIFF